MSAAIDLLHLTDTHLLGSATARLHGWNVAGAWLTVWRQACFDHPTAQACLLGGDLVDDGSAAGYHWLDRQLANFARPMLAVAGNHEAPDTMARCLTRAQSHAALRLGPWQIIGLNSHVNGAEHGQLGAFRLAELADRLDAHPGPNLLMIHHPPIATGTPWIDAMGLADAKALADVIHDRGRSVRGILAGHVHQQAAGWLGDCPVWTTPSTMRQFLPGARDFAEDACAEPGYRHVRLWPNGRLETDVTRVPIAAAITPLGDLKS